MSHIRRKRITASHRNRSLPRTAQMVPASRAARRELTTAEMVALTFTISMQVRAALARLDASIGQDPRRAARHLLDVWDLVADDISRLRMNVGR